MLHLNIFFDPLDALHHRGILTANNCVFNEYSGCVPLVDPELPIKYVVLEVVIEADPLQVGVSGSLRQLF
jgi:hypothetical protein